MEDQISYGRRARLRAALSAQASEIADSARGLVSTYSDGYAQGGEFIDAAARIAADARQLLELAVAYERRRGTSWELIGGGLSISRQAAHDRFGDAVKRLDQAMIRCWLLGDDPRAAGLPYGAADTAEAAALLDDWVTRHLQATDPLARKPEDDPERLHPVSRNLPPMDIMENSALVQAAAAILSERVGIFPSDLLQDDYSRETRELELGLTRRKVEFYERVLADDQAGRPTGYGASLDQVRDLLVAARARLAELEAAGELGGS